MIYLFYSHIRHELLLYLLACIGTQLKMSLSHASPLLLSSSSSTLFIKFFFPI